MIQPPGCIVRMEVHRKSIVLLIVKKGVIGWLIDFVKTVCSKYDSSRKLLKLMPALLSAFKNDLHGHPREKDVHVYTSFHRLINKVL